MIVGNPIVCTIQCRNQAGVLFDPDVLQVSIIKGDGSEDSLQYGGTNPSDSFLTRTGVGLYLLWFQTTVPGDWSVLPRWQQETADPQAPISVTSSRALIFPVTPTNHTFADRSA